MKAPAAIHTLGRVVSADAESVIVEVPAWPGHRPGQFAMLKLSPEGPHLDPLLPRPMAIYRGEGNRLEFRFKVVGRGTAALSQLAPSELLGVTGPLGNGFELPSEQGNGRTLLVGGGTGIASLYELARDAATPPVVLLGGRSRSDILGLAAFEKLPVDLRIATEDGSLGHRGRVTELIDAKQDDQLYACGPTAMMRAVYEIARKAGARCRVSLETNMACGFGICLGCVVQTRDGFRYVCTDGPVFEAEELEWEASP